MRHARLLLMSIALGLALGGCGGGDGDGDDMDAGTDSSTDVDSSTDEEDASEPTTACSSDPCQNDGVCFSMGTTGFLCQCVNGYSGNTCQNPPVEEENGWGTNGLATISAETGDVRGRAIVALPDNGAIVYGSEVVSTGNLDALVARYDATGHLVPAFDTDGIGVYNLMTVDEAFFAGAVSADGLYAAGVGYAGTSMTPFRDSAIHILDLTTNTGAAYVRPLAAASVDDRLHAVTFGEVDGTTYVYAAGYRTASAMNNELVVARFTLDGDLDTDFGGGDGIVSFDLSASGTVEQAKGIIVRDDGRIVVVGEIEASATDNDIVVVGLTADGELDTTFGVDADEDTTLDGYVVLSFGTGNGSTRDNMWNADVDANGNIVIFGSRASTVYSAANVAGNPGTNRQRVIARVLANGSGFDTSFNAMPPTTSGSSVVVPGVVAIGIGPLSLDARAGEVQPDGKIISGGYTSMPTGAGTQSANAIVLVRLLPDGKLDAPNPAMGIVGFGAGGIVVNNPFPQPFPTAWGFAEAYGAALRPDGTYVTTGYGRVEAAQSFVQMVAFRFDTDGRRFTTSGH